MVKLVARLGGIVAMNLKDIRKLAKEKGLASTRLRKKELIRSIQNVEGNFDCYGTNYDGNCDQHNCSWRESCVLESRKMVAEA